MDIREMLNHIRAGSSNRQIAQDVGGTANVYSIFTVDELQRRHDEFSPLAGV
jgi:hypothetical protein